MRRTGLFIDGDCEMPEFRDLATCTNPPLFDTVTSFTICIVGTTTVCGIAYWGCFGFCKQPIAKQHSD